MSKEAKIIIYILCAIAVILVAINANIVKAAAKNKYVVLREFVNKEEDNLSDTLPLPLTPSKA